MLRGFITFLLVSLFLSCAQRPVENAYSLLVEASRKSDSGRTIGRADQVEIRADSFQYAIAGGRTIDATTLKGMQAVERDLTIRRAIARKLAIREGIKEHLFDSTDAVAFLLPRLESLLEEYYYYAKSNPASVRESVQRLAVDDAALTEFAKKNPGVTRASLGVDQMRTEQDRLLNQMFEVRLSQEKRLLMASLLARHRMEISP